MLSWFRFFSRWPLWALHLLGSVGGWLAWCFSGRYRRRFLKNVRLAGLGWGTVIRAVGHAGRMSAELPRLWLGQTPPVAWVDDRTVVEAYGSGQGVLFLTPHMGCFEITAQALAQRFSAQHGPLTVLYRPARQAWLAAMLQASRSRQGLLTVPTNLQGVRKLLKALRKGEAVGLLPDQVPPLGMGIWSPVWGRPAYTMTLAAKLVLQTGADVVVAWGERLPWGQGYRIHARKLEVDLQADLDAMVAQVNSAMEDLVRQCPTQYLWGYERYKQPRQESFA